MTYLAFLAIFVAPPLLALALAARKLRTPRFALAAVALPLIALAYTTPWDNYLVATGVWAYGDGRVIGTIGYVPVEEYLFMMAQSLAGVLWLVRCRLHEVPVAHAPAARALGAGLWLMVALTGALLLGRESTRYLGLIVAWAAPVLAIQWWFTGDVAVAAFRRYALVVAVPVLYLWLADAIAIRSGAWSISERFTVGVAPFGLPVEEMTFFLLTHLLSVHGALLLLQPARFALALRPAAA